MIKFHLIRFYLGDLVKWVGTTPGTLIKSLQILGKGSSRDTYKERRLVKVVLLTYSSLGLSSVAVS